MATDTPIAEEAPAMPTFDHSTRGTLAAGTVTRFGLIVQTSYTAYKMAGGEWVSFDRVHGVPPMASPLVVFG